MKKFMIDKKTLATLDFETDPFKYGRTPEPFACGLHVGDDYFEWWNNDADSLIDAVAEFLKNYPEPLLIYAHNGGKFDFYFLLYKKLIQNPIKIINSRLTKAHCFHHELRDSYSIIPVPLAIYLKDEIDYKLFDRDIREKHKDDILHYLAKDCEYLYKLVHAFLDRFGLHLTIGGLSIKTLSEYHPFVKVNQSHDEAIRPYYMGGRVQCFERGIIDGDFKVIDVNSMYPYVMSELRHPCGESYLYYYDDKSCWNQLSDKGEIIGDITKPYFLTLTCENNNAFAVRTLNGLSFEEENGTFKITSHEFQAALKHGLISDIVLHELVVPEETINFKAFVGVFVAEKIQAKKDKDKLAEIFSKLILNSSYGKTGQNPENFMDYLIHYDGEPLPDLSEWELDTETPFLNLFCKDAPRPIYYDVAIAASVTGAARAVLLNAIYSVERPFYCDTDSLIYTGGCNLDLDPYKLGAWDLEATGDKLAIAGKKLYALYKDKECVKMASKGAKLEPKDILKVASGHQVVWESDAPNFKINGDVNFTKRRINRK